MRHFAKLFTAPDGAQVLIILKGESEEGRFGYTLCTEHNGIRLELDVLCKETHSATAEFEGYDEEKAFALRQRILSEFMEPQNRK